MQYQVPQFIETEDTIIGPLTIRQFVYLFIAGGLSFVLYFFLAGFLWLTVTALLVAMALALGFIKYNGQPLINMLGYFFLYFWRPRLFVWRRQEELEALRAAEAAKRESPLQDLWLKLTTGREQPINRESTGEARRFQTVRHSTGDTESVRRIDYRR